MTGLSTAEPVAAAQGRERRRRTRWIIAGLAVVVVLALAIWIGWIVLVGRVADKVDAGWTLDCAPGTTVGVFESEPAIRSRPGWQCDVSLTIRNESDRDIRVRRVVSPFLGSGGGAEIKAFATDDAELSDGGDGLDAVWTVDVEIPAHARRTIILAIGWRQDGCSAGGHMSLVDWPTIELEALNRTFEYRPEQRLVLRGFDDRHDQLRCAVR